MHSTSIFPSRVSVSANDARAEGLAINLRFEMHSKNSFDYTVFLNHEGRATVSAEELLRTFDEDRSMFIMDYDDPRLGFTGRITAKVLSTSELHSAVDALETFRGKCSFPVGYEGNLRAALARGQNPDEYQIEVNALYPSAS
jgi:hypothetical protein